MRFRFLQPAYINGRLYEVGEVSEMSNDFIPPAACEPLDAAGALAMWKAGPQVMGLQRQVWFGVPMPVPQTYWKPIDAAQEMWRLVGLGSDLPAVKWTSDADPRALP
jgi:hypothetical protein